VNHISGWGWYWLIWFVGGFGIAEAFGLLFNARDTLSWQFWGLERINFGHPFDFADWTWLHYLLASILLVGLVWLGGHIILGIWR
jgi:hypothetical protein